MRARGRIPRPPRLGRLALRAGIDPSRCGARWLFEPRRVIARDRRDERHLRMLLAFTLRPDSCCLDVGAYVGGVLDDLVRLAPAGRHIAWEPIPALAERLDRRHPGVEVRRAALSDRAGEAEFTEVVSLPAYSGLRERAYPGPQETRRILVRTERLDDALPAGLVPALVKIDVEGAEREVIAGGIETLARHRPVVVFEHQRGAGRPLRHRAPTRPRAAVRPGGPPDLRPRRGGPVLAGAPGGGLRPGRAVELRRALRRASLGG